jgi:ribokinase
MIVVGSANADLVFQIVRLPKPGETMAASSLETLPGGKVSIQVYRFHNAPTDIAHVLAQGANQAAAAAKLGYPTYFVGQVRTEAEVA